MYLKISIGFIAAPHLIGGLLKNFGFNTSSWPVAYRVDKIAIQSVFRTVQIMEIIQE